MCACLLGRGHLDPQVLFRFDLCQCGLLRRLLGRSQLAGGYWLDGPKADSVASGKDRCWVPLFDLNKHIDPSSVLRYRWPEQTKTLLFVGFFLK